jgi:predicted CXXCH cytochrome family protein
VYKSRGSPAVTSRISPTFLLACLPDGLFVSRPILAFVLVTLFVTNWSYSQQTVRTADAVCAGCHAEIYRKYLTSPMANASGQAIDNLIPGEFKHVLSGVTYKVIRSQNQAWLSFADANEARASGKRRLDYFLGSGHLGVTYLYIQEGYLLESPVAWYAATDNYDMKPGFGQLEEMPPALPVEANCLRCHMSGVTRAEAGTINRYAGLPFKQTGIVCESCHGDTSAHIRTKGKGALINPAKLDPEQRDSVCISCHLEGDVSVERAGRSALDYAPGESISKYLSYFVLENTDSLRRGVSEVEQFNDSKCKRTSGERMSCTSCHDPHGSPEPAKRILFYRTKCMACHNAPEFINTHHTESPDCAGCHMPRNPAQNIPHVAWTDHRILRQPVKMPMPSQAREGQLTALFSPQANARDAAVAMYDLIIRGKAHNAGEALAKLKQVYVTDQRDPHVLEAMGVLAGLQGDAAESEVRLQELLAIQPLNLTAISDLGVLLARRGNMLAAIEIWQPSFARNKDLIGLARNLAAAQCAIGTPEDAQKTIADALEFSPGNRQSWNFSCKSK